MADSPGPHAAFDGAKRAAEAKRAFLVGLLVALFVIVGYELAEPWLGTAADTLGFEFIARLMPLQEHPDVIVVDIGQLPRNEKLPPKWASIGYATPRAQLQAILRAIAAQQPAAIGVDIDFSADDAGFLTEAHDRRLFDSLLPASAGVPVFLGVSRSAAGVAKSMARDGPPAQAPHWLGDHAYDGLAASIDVPIDTLKLIAAYSYGPRVSLPTMSAALAGAYQQGAGNGRSAPRWPAWFAVPTTPWTSHLGYAGKQYIVDYSSLPAMVDRTFATIDPHTIEDQKNQFAGRIVLVGDASLDAASGRDSFELPYAVRGIEGDRAILPGIFFHAAGASTLIDPLYQLTPVVRTLIDLLLCAAVLAVVLWMRLFYAERTSRNVATHRLTAFGFVLAATIVVLGVVIVGATRLVWEDWLLVVVVLLAHPTIERRVVAGSAWMKTQWPSVRDRIALEEPSE